MLHNHLRNFTSHKLVIDLDPPDKADHSPNRVDELRSGIEVAGYHVGSLRNAGDAVALREGGGDGGKEKCRRKKNLVLSHCDLFLMPGGRVDSPPFPAGE